MKLGHKLLIGAFVFLAFPAAIAIRQARRQANHPCNEPADLPVPRERIVRCVERYVEDQWYTRHWGKVGALDADPHGQGSWLELMSTHRGTLNDELSALCTHPKDPAGALGHLALFESPEGDPNGCRVFSVTPLLGVSLKDQPCQSVRERSLCSAR